jgi:hypothetical protein
VGALQAMRNVATRVDVFENVSCRATTCGHDYFASSFASSAVISRRTSSMSRSRTAAMS